MTLEVIFIAKKKGHSDLKRMEHDNKSRKIRMSVPLPVSINHMYVPTRNGGKRLNKNAEEYVRVSRGLINQAIEDCNWKIKADSTWFYVDMVFYFPDQIVRDSHNMLKLLFDVLQGAVFMNDYYAMPRILSVELDAENPRVDIYIHNQTTKEREKFVKEHIRS
jgi:Holliday junction resolvase RusA-like endonuclease